MLTLTCYINQSRQFLQIFKNVQNVKVLCLYNKTHTLQVFFFISPKVKFLLSNPSEL